MPWHVDSFAAPMNADTAVASFAGQLGNGTFVNIEVATHDLGTTSTITVPDFQTTRVDGALNARASITTQADAYDQVAAYLSTVWETDTVTGQPLSTIVWRVFTYRGATLTAHALPTLPAGMKDADLHTGGAAGQVWVLSGVDPARPPWTSATLDGIATVAASR